MDIIGIGVLALISLWLVFPAHIGRTFAKTVKSFQVAMGELKRTDLE